MVNVDRVVVVASAALAVVAAVTFGVTAFGPTRVSIDQGAIACAPSSADTDEVFGIRVENRSDHPATLHSLEARSRDGIGVIRTWALPSIPLESRIAEPGTATIPDVAGWSGRRPVEGASLPAHSAVVIAVNPRLTAGSTSGTARDFVVRFTPQGGIERSEVSGWVVGYRPRCG